MLYLSRLFKGRFQNINKALPKTNSHRSPRLLPQSTLQSIEAALFKCDLVEFDVLLTKDHQVVIFHDRQLSNITKIAKIQKFKDRRKLDSYEADETQKVKNDCWARDFTLQELKEVKVKQVFPQRPQLAQLTFRIPTLEEAITEILKMKSNKLLENRCGFAVDIKGLWEGQQNNWDKIWVEKIADLREKINLFCQKSCNERRLPIVLQLFSHQVPKTLENTQLNLPVIHLFDKVYLISEQFLSQKTVRRQIGITITEQNANQAVRQLCNHTGYQPISRLSEEIAKYSRERLILNQKDKRLADLLLGFEGRSADKKTFGCNNYRQAYHHLIKVEINGVTISQSTLKIETLR